MLLLVFIHCKLPLTFWFGTLSALNTCFETRWQTVTNVWSLFPTSIRHFSVKIPGIAPLRLLHSAH